jgi:uncharacterized membrane protein YedE/YeeE
MNINLFKYVLGPFFGGVLFALGLGISGMTEASNIIGFLDILGHWKPALIFVLASALITYGILFRIITKLPKPLVDKTFHIPTLIKIDRRLVIGSLLFGVGWGLPRAWSGEFNLSKPSYSNFCGDYDYRNGFRKFKTW